MEKVVSSGVDFNLIQVVLQITKRIGLEIAEEYRVLIVFESVSERGCEVVPRKVARVPSNLVLKVGYVRASTMPANFFILCLPVTVD